MRLETTRRQGTPLYTPFVSRKRISASRTSSHPNVSAARAIGSGGPRQASARLLENAAKSFV